MKAGARDEGIEVGEGMSMARDTITVYEEGTGGVTPEFRRKMDHVMKIFRQTAREMGADVDNEIELRVGIPLEGCGVCIYIMKKGLSAYYRIKVAEGIYNITWERWTTDVRFYDNDFLRRLARAAFIYVKENEWTDEVEPFVIEWIQIWPTAYPTVMGFRWDEGMSDDSGDDVDDRHEHPEGA